MEHVFYVNVLFGKNKKRIFDEIINKFMVRKHGLTFQVHPFRISPLSELSENSKKRDQSFGFTNIRNDIRQHLTIMEDINRSGINNVSKKYENTIFVNYTTKELEPALRFDRIRYYLCDYINDDNIELVTMANLIFINFFKKHNNEMKSLNSHFMTYSTLIFHDTNAANRISNVTSLDIGEETDDDVTFILRTKLNISSENSDYNTATGIILPYHPFRQSLFTAIENTKDNINAIKVSNTKHLIYYPFEQHEWLEILKNIMYEHVFLNFLVSDKLYLNESVSVNNKISRSIASCCFKHFNKVQQRYQTHALNDVVFNLKNLFQTRNIDKTNWLKSHYLISNVLPQFACNFQCTKTANGILL